MKEFIVTLSSLLIIIAAVAQRPSVSSSAPIKVNPNAVKPQAAVTPGTPPRTMTTATGMLAPQKDLALSDLNVSKDLSTGNYIVSCKITNVGMEDIDLFKIAYFKCNHRDYDTPMNGMIVQCNIDYGSCPPNSACGYWPGFMLFVYNPDGTAMVPGTGRNIIKSGQSLTAKVPGGSQIPLTPDCGSTLKVTLVLDPLNKVGDENLANNKISATVSR